MATKYISLQIIETGITVYARIQQESTGNWYDPVNGDFDSYVEPEVVALTEDTNVKQKYSWNGGGSVAWTDGRYYVYAYKQVGGSPDDDNDEAAGSGVMVISNDEEVTNDALDDELTLIKARTDNLPADPASETSLTTINGIVTDTRRIVKNKLTIDKANSKLQLWDDAGTAIMYEWPLTDKNGSTIALRGTGPSNRGVPTTP